MTLNIDNFKEILQEQRNIISELSELAAEQFEVLKENNIQKLAEITALQEEKGRKLAILERKRREILNLYSQESGKEIKSVNDIYECLDNLQKKPLQKLIEEIRSEYKMLVETTELNKLLLKQGLMYANRILSSLSTSKNVYSKTGNIQNLTAPEIIDKSV